MPAAGFIPGPGDVNPVGQLATLMTILRENKESEARIAQAAAQTNNAVLQGTLYRQQAELLGMKIQDEPKESALRMANLASQTAGNYAQAGEAGTKALTELLTLPSTIAGRRSTATYQEGLARHATALADQEQYHQQQLKELDAELKTHGADLMKALGYDGPMVSFGKNQLSFNILQDALKTQADTRLKEQHGAMYDAMAQKANDWARVQQERLTQSGSYKNLQLLGKLAKDNPGAASAYVNDSDPIVAKVAQAIVNSPTKPQNKNLTPGQVLGNYLNNIVHDPNTPDDVRMKALIQAAQISGVKPDLVPQSYDPQTGAIVPEHFDWQGLQTKMEQSGVFSQPVEPTNVAPTTSTPTSQPATAPARIAMTKPNGQHVMVRADQHAQALQLGYKDD